MVQVALHSILNDIFPNDGRHALLVADEYHMLSREHKEELLNWVSSRLNWVQVVLIGNREIGNTFDSFLKKTPSISDLIKIF